MKKSFIFIFTIISFLSYDVKGVNHILTGGAYSSDSSVSSFVQDEEVEWVPGEILVKFKLTREIKQKLQSYENEKARQEPKNRGSLNKSNSGTQNIVSVGIASIDQLNQKYQVSGMDKVFPTAKKPGADGTIEIKGSRYKVPDLSTIYRLKIAINSDILEVVEIYSDDPNVEYAEPNYIYHTYETIPNEYPDRDALAASQWALDKIQAPEAWDIETGSPDVIIGIIDTGVDWDHPDLEANIWLNPGEDPWADPNDPATGNGIDDDGNGYIDDWKGWDFVENETVWPGEDGDSPDNDPMDFFNHGTGVAGIASAVTNNSLGIAGTAWNCKLMVLRAGYKDTEGRGAISVTYASQAIIYAANNGVDIINMSFGGVNDSRPQYEAINYAYATGSVLVASAGNDNVAKPFYPAIYDNVLCVAASDENDKKAEFSNYGVETDVTAPGVQIYTTALDNTYEHVSGTSASASFVSALGALIISANPSWTNGQIMRHIIGTADTVDDENPDYTGLLGSGRIDVFNAVMPPSVQLRIIDYSYDEGMTDQNGMINPGETVNLNLTLQSNSIIPITNIHGILSTEDNFISIITAEGEFSDVQIGESSNSTVYAFHVDPSCPSDHNVIFFLELLTDQGPCNDSFVIPLDEPCSFWGWPKRMVNNPQYYLAIPVLADLDKNGDLEIIVKSYNHDFEGDVFIHILNHDGSAYCPPILLGENVSSGTDCKYPVVCDVDNDGIVDIIDSYTKNNGSKTSIVITHTDGTVMSNWPREMSCSRGGCASVYDVDHDGYLEIFVVSDSVYAWRYDGSPLDGWPKDFDYYTVVGQAVPASPSFGDIDQDGDVEIIFGSALEGQEVHAYHVNGSQVSGWPVVLPEGSWGVLGSVSIGDIDDDDVNEVVAFRKGSLTLPNVLYAWEGDGTPVSGWPHNFDDQYGILSPESPVLADLDGNGDLEVILQFDDIEAANPTDDNMIIVFNSDGMMRPGWPKIFPTDVDIGFSSWSGPVAADIDDDNEMEIIAGLGTYQMYIWNPDGSVLPGFPRYVNHKPLGTCVGDVDGDGDFEIVQSDKEYLYVYTGFGSADETKIEWGQYRHDKWATGLHGHIPELNEHPPRPFSLVSPIDDSYFAESSPVLDWQDTSDPDGDNFTYTLYYGTDNTFRDSDKTNTVELLITSQHGITNLVADKTYYWKVVAVDEHGFQRPSREVWRFTVTSDISIRPDSILFGGVWLGNSSTLDFKIFNMIETEIQIDNILSTSPDFVINPPISFTIVPSDSHTVQIAFSPTFAVTYQDSIIVITNTKQQIVKIKGIGMIVTFSNIASSMGVDNTGDGKGVFWGDYDRDGDEDIYITNYESLPHRPIKNALYRNDGTLFTDVTLQQAVEDSSYSFGAAWGDYDNDGDLDLFVATLSQEYGIQVPSSLYRNDGNIFAEVGAQIQVNYIGYSQGVAWLDFDNNGDLDLYVANSGQPNLMYRNDGSCFTEKGFELGVDAEAVSMIACGNFDNDGDTDIFVSDANGLNVLFRNDGDHFIDVSDGMGVSGEYDRFPGGGAWGDYDNDGDLDLFIAYKEDHSRLLRNDGDHFTNVAQEMGIDYDMAYGVTWGDYDNDGDLDIFLSSNHHSGESRLYRNDTGLFTDVSGTVGIYTSRAVNAAWGDVDFDYDLDLYIVEYYNYGNRLYRNDGGNQNNAIIIKTVGTVSNRSGIGTRLKIITGNSTQIREVGAGTAGPFAQNMLPVHFGLGRCMRIDSLIALWPSGIVQTFTDVDANQVLTIIEPHSIADFTGSPESGLAPLPVVFTDESSGEITEWEWSFPGGTPSTANGQGPHEVTYENEGEYDVSLTVSGPHGSDTKLMPAYIVVGHELVTVDFEFPGFGWYMVSLPVIPQERTVSTLFPTALGGNAFFWNTEILSYETKTQMETKKAYWIAIPAQTVSQVIGVPLYTYNRHFSSQGWHMIGSVMGSIDFTNPNDNPDGFVHTPVFGWDPVDGAYNPTTTIDEKNGYWAAVFGECDLTVGPTGGYREGRVIAAKTDWQTFVSQYGSMPPTPPPMDWKIDELNTIPTEYRLFQNYPNPFNPKTTIRYQLPENGRVTLVIYNMMGQEVKKLVDKVNKAGYYEVVWDGCGKRGETVGSGIYIVHMRAGSYSHARKLMVVQ